MSGRPTGRLVRAALALAGAALLGIVPRSVVGHAIDQTFTLPVPLGLYLAGAGAAVAASFAVTALAARTAPERPRYRTVPLAASLARWGSGLLAALGLAWWYGAIGVAFAVGDISPLPAVLFWVGIWVALPLVAVVLGNPWPSLSPFRSTLGLLERAARLAGVDRLDAGLRYPAAVARWPAVLLLATALWAELILPGAENAATVGTLMTIYTLLTLAGAVLFGRVAWLRNAELFEVTLGWFGRVGPLGRRAASATVCEGCGESCVTPGCVDCPECVAAAEAGELHPELRPWFVGLTEIRRAGWSDAAFIVLLLAGVTYDGLQETPLWSDLARGLLPALGSLLGTATAFQAVGVVGLLGTFAAFMAAFVGIVGLARALSERQRLPGISSSIGTYAATLLPIAGGYLVAHYLTLVIRGLVWLPGLLADPMLAVAPVLSWVPAWLVWYLSVASIVGGHVVAVVLAHRIALREAPSRPIGAGVPLVALMVSYTVLSLWIIAQPIVVDPALSGAHLP